MGGLPSPLSLAPTARLTESDRPAQDRNDWVWLAETSPLSLCSLLLSVVLIRQCSLPSLASDSVFLKSVVEAKLAPSRTWAFDYGQLANEADSPGELVIGGYNPSKASYEDFTNYTLFANKSTPCPLQVQVQGMRWGGVNLMDGQGVCALIGWLIVPTTPPCFF